MKYDSWFDGIAMESNRFFNISVTSNTVIGAGGSHARKMSSILKSGDKNGCVHNCIPMHHKVTAKTKEDTNVTC